MHACLMEFIAVHAERSSAHAHAHAHAHVHQDRHSFKPCPPAFQLCTSAPSCKQHCRSHPRLSTLSTTPPSPSLPFQPCSKSPFFLVTLSPSVLLPQARFAKWEPILQLRESDLDYSSDGIMVSPSADIFGRGVYHYVRALAFASAAAHETGEEPPHPLVKQQLDCCLTAI